MKHKKNSIFNSSEAAGGVSALCDLPVGQRASVCRISPDIQKRLYDIGVTESAEISCVGVSPLGDPRAYLVRGAVIAIRKCDGRRVSVCIPADRGEAMRL